VVKPSAAEADALREEFFGMAGLIYGRVEILELLPMSAIFGRDRDEGEGIPNRARPVRLDDLRGCSQCAVLWDVSAGAKTAKPKVCGGCGSSFYCNKRCQKLHWRGGHREECPKIKEAKLEQDKMCDAFEAEIAATGQRYDCLFSSQPLVQFIRTAIWAFSNQRGGVVDEHRVVRLLRGTTLDDCGDEVELVPIGDAFRSSPPWTVAWTTPGALSEEELAFIEGHRPEFARLYD
jgi:hypothetical protein